MHLDCENKFDAQTVEDRFGQVIRDALKDQEVEHVTFTFGVHQQEQERQNREIQNQWAAETEARKRQEMEALSLEEQFALLVAAYPRKESDGYWSAKRTFMRLARRGELPKIYDLLALIRERSASEDWTRNNGKYILSLRKWLRNKPWWRPND